MKHGTAWSKIQTLGLGIRMKNQMISTWLKVVFLQTFFAAALTEIECVPIERKIVLCKFP